MFSPQEARGDPNDAIALNDVAIRTFGTHRVPADRTDIYSADASGQTNCPVIPPLEGPVNYPHAAMEEQRHVEQGEDGIGHGAYVGRFQARGSVGVMIRVIPFRPDLNEPEKPVAN